MRAHTGKVAISFFAVLTMAAVMGAAEPIPKVLTQAKLDRFLAEMDTVMANEAVSAAWEGAVQSASMEAVMNPNSNFGNLSPVAATYALLNGARVRIKTDAGINTELQRLGWTSEFWDVYVAMAIGIHYASVIDFNKRMAAEGAQGGPVDAGLPPIESFMHKDDFALIRENFQRIFSLVGEELARQNGF